MSVLPIKTKLNYGFGSFASAAKDTAFHYFLFFYYTQLLGLSASLAGLAALLALVADGISDPIIGQLSDNKKSGRWGRRHPFMILAVVPFVLSILAIFNPPEYLSQTGLFAWYLGFAILVRTFLTLFVVPYMALGAELSNDYDERTSIGIFRTIFGYSGGLSIQGIAWFILIPTASAAGMLAEGYRNVGFVVAFVATLGMCIAILGTRNRIQSLPVPSTSQQQRPWYFAFIDIVMLMRVQSARVLLCGSLVMATVVGASNTMLLHINNFFYGFSAQQTGIFMLCVFFSLLPASWLALKGTLYFGKGKTLWLSILLMAFVGPIPILAHLYGLAPATGSYELLMFVSCFVVVHQALYITGLNIVGGMIPDVIDDVAFQTQRRQEGLVNSAMMLTQKVTFGIGAFIAGISIDFAGLDGVTSITQVSNDMTWRLALIYGPGLSFATLVAVAVYTRYRLSREKILSIRQSRQKNNDLLMNSSIRNTDVNLTPKFAQNK